MVDSGIQPGIRHQGDVVTVVIAENDNSRGVVQFDVSKVGGWCSRLYMLNFSLKLVAVTLLCPIVYIRSLSRMTSEPTNLLWLAVTRLGFPHFTKFGFIFS